VGPLRPALYALRHVFSGSPFLVFYGLMWLADSGGFLLNLPSVGPFESFMEVRIESPSLRIFHRRLPEKGLYSR
jgi:hypothetical protein